jgi:hypothetical protein
MNNSDIRQKQLRAVLDEDMNVQKRVMRTQVKVQQVTPSAIRPRVALETRVKYNLSLLFDKFRLELEDSIDDYNENFVSYIEVHLLREEDTIVFQGDIETWDISAFLKILQEGDTIHINIK